MRHPCFHRQPKGLFSAGLFIATTAAIVTQAVAYAFPNADKGLPYLWFGVVLGPVTASFIFESCKMRAATLIAAENRLKENKIAELKASIDLAKQQVSRSSTALNQQLENLLNPHDAAATARFEDAKHDVETALKELSSAIGALQKYLGPD